MQQIVASLLTMILIQPDGLRATLSVYLTGYFIYLFISIFSLFSFIIIFFLLFNIMMKIFDHR